MRSKVRGLLFIRDWWLAIARVRDNKVHVMLDIEESPARPAFSIDITMAEAFEIEDALHEARTGHALPLTCDHG